MTDLRAAMLAELILKPSSSATLSELATRLNTRPSSLQRELATMSQAGIFVRERIATRIEYRANLHCPIFLDLQQLLAKTLGLVDSIRIALGPEEGQVLLAYIEGDFAKRIAKQEPGLIALTVVGLLSESYLAAILKPVSEALKRPIVFRSESRDEFLARWTSDPAMRKAISHEATIVMGELPG